VIERRGFALVKVGRFFAEESSINVAQPSVRRHSDSPIPSSRRAAEGIFGVELMHHSFVPPAPSSRRAAEGPLAHRQPSCSPPRPSFRRHRKVASGRTRRLSHAKRIFGCAPGGGDGGVRMTPNGALRVVGGPVAAATGRIFLYRTIHRGSKTLPGSVDAQNGFLGADCGRHEMTGVGTASELKATPQSAEPNSPSY